MNIEKSAARNVVPTAAGICDRDAICAGVATTEVEPAGIVSVCHAPPQSVGLAETRDH